MKKTADATDGDDVCCSRLEHLIFRTVVTLAHVAVFRSRRERAKERSIAEEQADKFPFVFALSSILAFCLPFRLSDFPSAPK